MQTSYCSLTDVSLGVFVQQIEDSRSELEQMVKKMQNTDFQIKDINDFCLLLMLFDLFRLRDEFNRNDEDNLITFNNDFRSRTNN